MSETPIRDSPRYRSLLVELLRPTSGDMILSKGVQYVVQVEDQPVRQVTSAIDYNMLLDDLESLDYDGDAGKRQEALKRLTEAVTDFLNQAKLGDLKPPLQIDLVMTASELAGLPLELAREPGGRNLLGRADFDIELTRRIRLLNPLRGTSWRAKPRILFVSASLPGLRVGLPIEENKRALRDALSPWIEPLAGVPEAIPDERNVLVLLPNASLAAIAETCAKAAAENKPFTHIHILAHGTVVGKGVRERFGIALLGPDGKAVAVAAEHLAEALKAVAESCAVVTLAVCRGGADINPIRPGSSLAHRLHELGIPVVVGPQFPLTFPGSAIFTQHFYGSVLSGEDVRAALHTARVELQARSDQTLQDWAALVGYVRLPEDYTQYLIDVALQTDLAALQVTQDWFNHAIAHQAPAAGPLVTIADRIVNRIARLKSRLAQAERCGRKGVREENLGLLGSAEKRLAEVYFTLGHIENNPMRRDEAMQALDRSLAHYKEAFSKNLSHHWSGVQMLSLEAVRTGKIAEAGYWFAAMLAAKKDLDNENEYWAAGSLIELCLLAVAAGQQPVAADVEQYVLTLAKRVAGQGNPDSKLPFAIETTIRQLDRYCSWWTQANGFFPGAAADLSRHADELSKAVKIAWTASSKL